MSDDGLNLSRRKVLGGITTVGAASAAAGAGTFAMFSSEQSSSVGTVSTGTIRLDEPSVTSIETELGNSDDLGSNPTVSGKVTMDYSGSKAADLYLGFRLSEGSEDNPDWEEDELSATDVAENLYLNDNNNDKLSRVVVDSTDDGSTDQIHRDILNDDATAYNGGAEWKNINTPTLAGLESALPVYSSSDSGTTGDPEKKYGVLDGGDSLTVNLNATLQKSSGDPVGNAFQDESVVIEVIALAKEQGTTNN